MAETAEASHVWALEIHDLDDRNVLALDLPGVLDALGNRAAALDWITTDYHPVTEEETVEAFADVVYEAQSETPRSGVRLPGRELRAIAEKSLQTIDGQFVGVPSDTTTPTHDLVDLRRYPDSDASLVIKAVDSSFWVVITKSQSDVQLIRERFRDVRETDRALELGLRLGP